MIVTFHREGLEDLVWDNFKPGRLMTPEAEAIEKVTGMSFARWGAALMEGYASAGRALVWVLRKRDEPTLRYSDVVFPVGDLELDFDADEKRRMRAELAKQTGLTDEERAQVLAAIGAEEDDDEPSTVDPEDGPGNGQEASGSAAA